MNRLLHVTVRRARRMAIAVIGATVVLLGVAMLVLPGPGILTIVLGLTLLGVEFAFARRWVEGIKKRTSQAVDYARTRGGRSGPPSTPPQAS
jgi:drug/metabolite transporter (DMT)-like permease